MKKKFKIIFIALSVVLCIVLLDTMQSKIFNNKPVLKIVDDYNGGILYQKHKGILVDTYVFTNNSKKTVFKWEKYNHLDENIINIE